MLMILFYPLLACLILVIMHGYLGLHVMERRVIFIDLALAQIAALGAISTALFGVPEHSLIAYLVPWLFTLAGAWLMSTFYQHKPNISPEVFIGVLYVFSAALAVLLLAKSSAETDMLKDMLEGSILVVTAPNILELFLLYGAIGLFHWRFRDKFWSVSKGYHQEKPVSKLWDWLFYASFGLVVTSSVKIAGIFLVFSLLIIPAALAYMLSQRRRYVVTIGIGVLGSCLGLWGSAAFDLPTGPAIVGILGVMFLGGYCYKAVVLSVD